MSPSVILYSSNVYSSFKILPLNINLISSESIASYFTAHKSFSSFTVAFEPISTSKESPELSLIVSLIDAFSIIIKLLYD